MRCPCVVQYEGPSRHTVEEAMQDRVLLEAAQTPEDLQLVTHFNSDRLYFGWL